MRTIWQPGTLTLGCSNAWPGLYNTSGGFNGRFHQSEQEPDGGRARGGSGGAVWQEVQEVREGHQGERADQRAADIGRDRSDLDDVLPPRLLPVLTSCSLAWAAIASTWWQLGAAQVSPAGSFPPRQPLAGQAFSPVRLLCQLAFYWRNIGCLNPIMCANCALQIIRASML